MKKNVFHGYGRIIYQDGSYFWGFWKNGERQIVEFVDGQVRPKDMIYGLYEELKEKEKLQIKKLEGQKENK